MTEQSPVVLEQHPEEINPLGKTHAPAHERRTTRLLTFSLVAILILIPIIAAISYSPILNVFLGLLPLIATIILDMVALSHQFKRVVLWIILLGAHIIGLAFLWIINPGLSVQLNVTTALSISFLLGLLITLLAWSAPTAKEPVKHHTHVVAFSPEKLPEYVQSIEDKVKGLNFAIGRVYRASNGGTTELRTRLKVPSEWYNEFYSIKTEDMKEQLDKAQILVRKIHDRLKSLAHKEKEKFSEDELKRLKNLARNKNGEDTVIDVLKTNDRDPVEHYYVSAVDFCERIIEELDKLEKK